jgi:hypothetical protein
VGVFLFNITSIGVVQCTCCTAGSETF